ncbi:MAG: type II secretion system protein GspD [Coxiella sp. (in: Bacteria)]|nr:MAG: type II secretion system protein GspD [Coxiella sp. (in: g-proteobacteria)]
MSIRNVTSQIVHFLIAMLMAISLPIVAVTPPAVTQATSQIWNLKNADIRAITQTVSMITGKTFIIDPRVEGKITFVSHHPMSQSELYNAYLSMLQILNYAAIPSGHVIQIVPTVDANSMNNKSASRSHPGAGDELVVRVIPINKVSALQLIPVLRPLMPQWSSITAYAPSNSLILASTAANINHLVTIIRKMDSTSANETTIMTLKHANADDIVSVISKLETSERALGKTPNVSVAADKISNSILISGNLNNIMTTKALISQMDRDAKVNNDTARVIFLNYLSAKKLAPVLNKIVTGEQDSKSKTGTNTLTASKSEVSVQAEPDNDTALIVRAPRNIMNEIVKIVKSLDRKPQQVLVEAIIVKMDESLLNQLGIVWGTVNDSGQSTAGSQGTTSNNNTFALKMDHGIGFIAGGSLQALIHALNSHGSTDILSTPSIVVLNGQEATISDGKNVGLVNREYDNSNSANTNGDQNLGVPFNTIERKDITLSLTVTPQISPNHMLRLKILQKDDSLEQVSTSSSSDTNDNPVIDTSKITTDVLVRSNDILVLGGLIDHSATKQKSKVPILGDIPLIGRLFSYTNRDIEKRDLMIFLKPIILNTQYERHKQTMKSYHYLRMKELNARAGGKLSPDGLPVLPNIPQGKTRPPLYLPAPTQTVDKRSHHV